MIKGSNHIRGYLIYEGSVIFSFNFGAFWTKFESMCNRYKRPFFELLSWPPPFSQLFMMMDVVLCRKKNRRLGFFFSTGGIFGGLCTELRLFIIFIVVVSGIIPILDGHCHQKLCIILFPFSPLHLGFSHCHKLFILQRTLFLCTLHTFRFPFSQRLLLLYRSIHLKCSFRNVHTFIFLILYTYLIF